MSDIKSKYPSTSSVALTISLGSLASSSTLLAGQESTYIDNTTDLDIDHLLSGKIRTGTSPTVSTRIELWVITPYKIVSGTPSWPDVFDGTNSAETITSDNVKQSLCVRAWSTLVDATTDRDYFIPETSIKSLYGGSMPPFWEVFVTHNTAVNLNSTGGNHELHYFRVQRQTV